MGTTVCVKKLLAHNPSKLGKLFEAATNLTINSSTFLSCRHFCEARLQLCVTLATAIGMNTDRMRLFTDRAQVKLQYFARLLGDPSVLVCWCLAA